MGAWDYIHVSVSVRDLSWSESEGLSLVFIKLLVNCEFCVTNLALDNQLHKWINIKTRRVCTKFKA